MHRAALEAPNRRFQGRFGARKQPPGSFSTGSSVSENLPYRSQFAPVRRTRVLCLWHFCHCLPDAPHAFLLGILTVTGVFGAHPHPRECGQRTRRQDGLRRPRHRSLWSRFLAGPTVLDKLRYGPSSPTQRQHSEVHREEGALDRRGLQGKTTAAAAGPEFPHGAIRGEGPDASGPLTPRTSSSQTGLSACTSRNRQQTCPGTGQQR